MSTKSNNPQPQALERKYKGLSKKPASQPQQNLTSKERKSPKKSNVNRSDSQTNKTEKKWDKRLKDTFPASDGVAKY